MAFKSPDLPDIQYMSLESFLVPGPFYDISLDPPTREETIQKALSEILTPFYEEKRELFEYIGSPSYVGKPEKACVAQIKTLQEMLSQSSFDTGRFSTQLNHALTVVNTALTPLKESLTEKRTPAFFGDIWETLNKLEKMFTLTATAEGGTGATLAP